MLKKNEKLFCISAILLIILSACFVVLLKGSICGDDSLFHVQRIINIGQAYQNGVFIPRVDPFMLDNFGYGTSLFYGDAFLYVFGFLYAIGVNIETCVKLLYIFIIISTVLSMFYCASKIFKDHKKALIATMFYSLSSYYAIDLYIRAAIGETIAFIFIPWVLLGIYNTVFDNEKQWWPLCVGFTGLVLSHNLTFLLMAVLFSIFLAINFKRLIKKPIRILKIFHASICTILVSAWFLFPMLEQMLTTEYFYKFHASIFNPGQAAVRIRNLFFTITPQDFFTPAVGVGIFLLICFWLISFFNKRNYELEKFLDLCGLGGLFCLFMSTSIFPWGKLDPYLNIVQFPWRFHVFSTLFFSLCGAYWLSEFLNKIKLLKHNENILIVVLICINFALFNYVSYGEYKQQYDTNQLYDYSAEYPYYDEQYLHANANRKTFANRKNYVNTIRGINKSLKGRSWVEDYHVKYAEFEGNQEQDNFIELPIHYYYGYQVKELNTNTILKTSPSEDRGWLQADVSGFDAGKLEIKYVGTLVQKNSNYLSLISIIGLIILLLINKYNKNYRIKINENKRYLQKT